MRPTRSLSYKLKARLGRKNEPVREPAAFIYCSSFSIRSSLARSAAIASESHQLPSSKPSSQPNCN